MTVKNSDVLVLNKSWVPIHICDWHKAMSLLYQDEAHTLDSEYIVYKFDDWVEYSRLLNGDSGYKIIHTIKHRIAVPEIIILTRYNRLPQRDVKFSRQSVFARDDYTCAYCGTTHKSKLLSIDHVIPKSKGGTSNWDNVVTACKSCNAIKGDKTLKQAGLVLKFKPKQPSWFSKVNKMAKYPNVRPMWLKFLKGIDLHEAK